MNDFHDLDAAVSGAIDGAYAEAAVHRPRVSAQYVERRPDPDRSHHLIHGVFSAGPSDAQLKTAARGASFSGATRLASVSAAFWIARTQVDALTALPAKGDTITLISRAGAPVYGVSSIQHTDMGDLTLILVREDPPP